ncbi:MAG: SRPBCC family protein [Tildeniella torsiva UHER 1998/13D]|jgi:ribosome-associated toxin RatA of RatAB toxin-antitoxin module|nr:SRPBCC family protein [Tildeniella torsiva UHER 1998/13D]
MTATTPDTNSFESALLGAEVSAQAAGVTIDTEKLEGQQRRILASTQIPATADQVWQVLTDYDNLSSFIPNLSYSQRLSHPDGGIRLEQIGSQCFLNIKFCARVVLDMVEAFPKELRFSMVEGDFRQFEGKWTLEPVKDAAGELVCLGYDLVIRPPRAMPVALIERHIRNDLSRNLQAISDRTITLFAA